MAARRSRRAVVKRPAHALTVLVLQGGGALGAYQAGVYEGMQRSRHRARLGHRRVHRRDQRARSSPATRPRIASRGCANSGSACRRDSPLDVPAPFDLLRLEFNRWSASASAMFGVPGFFKPRFPSPLLTPSGSPGALSVYDTDAAARHAAGAGRLRSASTRARCACGGRRRTCAPAIRSTSTIRIRTSRSARST